MYESIKSSTFDRFMSDWNRKIQASHIAPVREFVAQAPDRTGGLFTGIEAFILGISADLMLAIYSLASY